MDYEKNNPDTEQGEGIETNQKTKKEIAVISKDIINILAENNCTIEDADKVLKIAKMGIDGTTVVRKLLY